MRADPESDWLRLDNAAKIYPSSSSASSPSVFRLFVRLRTPVRVSALERALERVLARCPYFQVSLKRGFFWYYLQRHDAIPPLELLKDGPFSTFPIRGGGGHLMRVQARQRTIAIDFSHVLTDGGGGLRFLGTLVTEYLRLCGVPVTDWAPFLDPGCPPTPEEAEDAHNRFSRRRLPKPPWLSRAYHVAAGRPASRGFRVILGRMPASGLLDLARAQGASLTEYMVALYMRCLVDIQRAEPRRGASVVRIEVPVNMRQFHPSPTMRNFSLYVSAEIDPVLGDYRLEEIVARVHHSMRIDVDVRELARQMARNVGAERNPLIRAAPLPFKNLMLSIARRRFGEGAYSGVLSNLGRVTVPASIEPAIDAFGFVLGPEGVIRKSCAVLSFRDDLHIAFGSVVEDRELERRFFTEIAHRGVPVAVEER